MNKVQDWLQRKWINFLVHSLFNMVEEKDILRKEGRKMFYRGAELGADSLFKIIEDARVFAGSTLWEVLTTEIQYQANRRMFVKSQNPSDILAGKLMLYVVDLMDKKLKSLAE